MLPAITLGLVMAAFVMRLTRSSLLEVLRRDYVRTARGKGVAEHWVIFKHALRNALIPVTTGIGIYLLTTLSGTITVELVFSRPGLGQLLIGGITARDYTMVQAGLVVFAFFVVLVNLLTDLLCAAIDPRITLKMSDLAERLGVDAQRGMVLSYIAGNTWPRSVRCWCSCWSCSRWPVPGWCRMIRWNRVSSVPAKDRPRSTGSAPTHSAATCSRACCWARRLRSRSA